MRAVTGRHFLVHCADPRSHARHEVGWGACPRLSMICSCVRTASSAIIGPVMTQARNLPVAVPFLKPNQVAATEPFRVIYHRDDLARDAQHIHPLRLWPRRNPQRAEFAL